MANAIEGKSVLVDGRIVWTAGPLFQGRKKTEQGTKKVRLDKSGNEMMEYGFGLAIPKQNLSQLGEGQPGHIWQVMHEQAYILFPSRQLPPSFSMKYKDGDGIDHEGKPFAQREGYAGHIILSLTTGLPIRYFRHENGQNIPINEGIKCGDYVRVQVHVKAHAAEGQGKAGLYLNPGAVLFLGYGSEIVNQPSGDSIFGSQAPAIPQGASATPVGPAPTMLMPTGAPMINQPPPVPVYQPAQQPPPPAAVYQAPQPHYGVLPQAHQPPPGGVPAPAGYPAVGMPAPATAAPYPNYPQQAPAPTMPGVPPGYPPAPGLPYPTQ